MKQLVLFIFALLSIQTVFAFPEHNPVPGGTAVIPLLPLDEEKPDAFYKKKRLAVLPYGNYWHAIVGLSLATKPGTQKITYHNSVKKRLSRSFDVKDKKYKAQYLTVKNKRKVNPAAEDMKRIKKERVRKANDKKVWTSKEIQPEFIWPVKGRISSIFGLRRFFNKQARRPHSGLDIAAPEGTPVKAVADATVIDTGEFFFSGNMIYLDHGQGVITLYAHLHSIKVKPGDTITKGQVIGTVGETGRVTGPHLHLSLILNQSTVDPVHWLPPR